MNCATCKQWKDKGKSGYCKEHGLMTGSLASCERHERESEGDAE